MRQCRGLGTGAEPVRMRVPTAPAGCVTPDIVDTVCHTTSICSRKKQGGYISPLPRSGHRVFVFDSRGGYPLPPVFVFDSRGGIPLPPPRLARGKNAVHLIKEPRAADHRSGSP